MGATPDFNRPSWNNPLDVDLDFVRDNQTFLMASAAQCGPILPGWNTSVNVATTGNYQYPDGYLLSHANGRTITISLTWTDKTYSTSPVTTAKIITQMQLAYYDGVATTTTFSAVTLTVQEAVTPNAILWDTSPLTTFDLRPYAGTSAPSFKFDNSDTNFSNESSVRWSMTANNTMIYPLTSLTFLTGEVLVMYDNITTVLGSADPYLQLNGTYNPSVWADASNATIRALDQSVNSPSLTGQIYTCDIHVAFDDGMGAPLVGTTVTKPCTFIAWGNDAYVIFDSLTGSNGTNLTAHTPDVQLASPGGWSVLAGGFEIQSNGAEATSANSMAVHDTGIADLSWRATVKSFNEDFALVGRVQDASNYWQLLVEDAGTSDPILKLNEVNAGTPTTRASATMTGTGPLGSTYNVFMHLVFSGNDIVAQLGATHFTLGVDSFFSLSYTSASFNSETRHGIQCASTSARWDAVYSGAELANWIAYL